MEVFKKQFILLSTLFMFFTPAIAQDIHIAAEEGNLELVKILLEKDPHLIASKDENRRTPLHMACRGVQKEIVVYLIENGADVNAKDVNDVTPLHSLSYRGLTDCMELLLKNGADIETKDADGFNPLFYAVYGGQKGAAEVLINNGADINIRNNHGLTLADIAKDRGLKELEGFLVSKGGKHSQVKEPEVFKFSASIYMVTFSYDQYTNIIACTGPDSVLIIDTGYYRTTEKLESTIEEIAEGRKIYIINTHLHIDHIGGNSIAGDQEKIINFSNLENKVSEGVIEKGKDSLKSKSGKIFQTYYTLNYNDREIRLIPFPGTHTDVDLIVHFVEPGIVHMGDLLISQSFPSLTRGEKVSEYLDILEKIFDIFPESTRFIAGHGRDLTMKEFKDYYKMLLTTIEIVKKGMQSGKSIEDMQKENILKDYESYNNFIPELNTDFWISVVFRNYVDKK
ncbi:ankyrin repeat domain-containing protein [candidate division KSB1 bacterium]